MLCTLSYSQNAGSLWYRSWWETMLAILWIPNSAKYIDSSGAYILLMFYLYWKCLFVIIPSFIKLSFHWILDTVLEPEYEAHSSQDLPPITKHITLSWMLSSLTTMPLPVLLEYPFFSQASVHSRSEYTHIIRNKYTCILDKYDLCHLHSTWHIPWLLHFISCSPYSCVYSRLFILNMCLLKTVLFSSTCPQQ